MSELTNCPNCDTELKSGLLSSIKLLEPEKTAIINEYHNDGAEGYCTNCGKETFKEYNTKLNSERSGLTEIVKNLIANVPIVSTHSPHKWDYDILDIVTGQSTTGTGVITEFTSSFTEFFGAQSGRHNKKLKKGENFCFAQLRKQALDIGGNAIIATDIDYAELGSIKGMIMVCMTGTAVNLKNLDVLENRKSERLKDLVVANKRLLYLDQYPVYNN